MLVNAALFSICCISLAGWFICLTLFGKSPHLNMLFFYNGCSVSPEVYW